MESKAGSLLDRLKAAREAAQRNKTRDLTVGDLVVRYRLPSDEAEYKSLRAPALPGDDASTDEIREALEAMTTRQLDLLIDSCVGLFYRDGEDVLPLASLRDDGDQAEALTFSHPEALELLDITPKGTARKDALAFFDAGAPDHAEDAVTLHHGLLLAWRGESLSEVGDVLTKGS